MLGEQIQNRLEEVLLKLSNDLHEEVEIKDEDIEKAVEDFRDALHRQLKPKEKRSFRLRMSNIGRPTCQLQMEASGAKAKPKQYNHILRMMLGDFSEIILMLLMKSTDIPVTGEKSQVELNIANTAINGEDDVEIANKVWDIKSASDWAYRNKWTKGFNALLDDDPFGYLGQMAGYSVGQSKKMGGWIVMNKSSGEIVCVDSPDDKDIYANTIKLMRKNVDAITNEKPFERDFEPIEEWFNRKLTGRKILAKQCSMCDFRATCWPHAQYQPCAESKAANPRKHWYVD
tara:strand:- start:445 stop:1305 length:861 start_codon:yes stop_codon:yes gene_type:complete